MFRKLQRSVRVAKQFVIDHRRHAPTAALAFGFIWDSITLGRPDRLFDNIVLLFYLILSGIGIVLLNRQRERNATGTPLYLLILIQFSFGNLASALFILYGQSSTIAGNWIFLLLLIGLLIGNEFFRSRYEMIRFHIGIYYLVLFAYLVLIVPILVNSIGVIPFLISGVLSLALIAGFVAFPVRMFAPRMVHDNQRSIAITVVAFFIGFNALYFLNLIPPVPLALKDIGMYHNVVRDGEQYRVTFEKPRWYEFWRDSDKTFHLAGGEGVYCFSSVFAPSDLETPVFHHFEHYNEITRKWETTTRIQYSLVGGRNEGFRGFSIKESPEEGRWRCSVETERGALIGRVKFEVEPAERAPVLVNEIR